MRTCPLWSILSRFSSRVSSSWPCPIISCIWGFMRVSAISIRSLYSLHSMLAKPCEISTRTSTQSTWAILFQTWAHLGQWNSARARLQENLCHQRYISQTTAVQDYVCSHFFSVHPNLSDIWLQKYRNILPQSWILDSCRILLGMIVDGVCGHM